MRANIIGSDFYWDLRKPFDRHLPESIPEVEVEAELATIQGRFRKEIFALGTEGEDWAFPDEFQHVRVFYVYLHSDTLYTSSLAKAVADALRGFDSWIGELECYTSLGMHAVVPLQAVFLRGEFYLEASDTPLPFAEALQLEVHQSTKNG